MNVGVFSLMHWPQDRSATRVFGDEIAQAVEAERLGYDRAWFAEHHFSRYGIDPAIHLTVANVAARTSRIRLGTAVTVLPFLPPIRAAEELATLDILSNGRIDWGVGRGYQRHEFDAFEVDITESRSRFEESLEIIFRAWQDGPFEHHGQHWNFDAVDVLPKPLQRPLVSPPPRSGSLGVYPRIPTYIAAISPESCRWAAENALPLLADQFSPFDRLADGRKIYEETHRNGAQGEPLPEAVVLRQVFVGRTREEARQRAIPGLLWYYRMLAKVGSPARHGEELPETYEAYKVFAMLSGMAEGTEDDFVEFLLNEVAIAGDADEVTDRLTALHEVGYPSVICWMNFGGLHHDDALASMRRFIDDVAPELPR
jgi:alkanesulfonate monooxygenase SsuD/methylene tetrahydromethanopterin reductase-like flavin-dependent oxidoreductase (luciferase family)